MPEERVPDVQTATIVLTGSFNPSILQPWWFVHTGILPAHEAEHARAVILDAFTQVSFSAFAVEALRERVVFTSLSDTPTPRVVRDVAVEGLQGSRSLADLRCGHERHGAPLAPRRRLGSTGRSRRAARCGAA